MLGHDSTKRRFLREPTVAFVSARFEAIQHCCRRGLEAAAARDGDDGTGDVRRLRCREEYIGRRQFGGLSGTAKRRLLTEGGQLVRPRRRRDQGRPDGAGSHSIDAYPRRTELLGERLGECNQRGLGHCVVDELR